MRCDAMRCDSMRCRLLSFLSGLKCTSRCVAALPTRSSPPLCALTLTAFDLTERCAAVTAQSSNGRTAHCRAIRSRAQAECLSVTDSKGHCGEPTTRGCALTAVLYVPLDICVGADRAALSTVRLAPVLLPSPPTGTSIGVWLCGF